MKARPDLALLVLALLASSVQAQSLERSLVGNGGAVVSGGGYQVPGTIGQPLIGVTAGGGSIVCSGWWCVERGTLVAVPGAPELGPTSFDRPRPNPARGSLVLAFTLARAGAVEVVLHDVTGARVVTLVSGTMDAGRREVRWDGTGSRGQPCAPGIYFVSFLVDGRAVNRHRIALLR